MELMGQRSLRSGTLGRSSWKRWALRVGLSQVKWGELGAVGVQAGDGMNKGEKAETHKSL